MQHFIKHVKPSNEYQVLFISDNHSSQLHFGTLNLAKENGIAGSSVKIATNGLQNVIHMSV